MNFKFYLFVAFLAVCFVGFLCFFADATIKAREHNEKTAFNTHLSRIKKDSGKDSGCIKTSYMK